jgi:uridylate kinase
MFKRILLKISGEALQGKNGYGIDYTELKHIAQEIIELKKAGHQVVVVVGAGNIWRHRDTTDSGIERTASDAMGMLGTVMNSVALQSATEHLGIESRVCSAIDIPQLAEPYIKRRAARHLEKDRIVFCAGGTGNPFFTTDSAAALRALELNCDAIIKATKVDGVYDSDPMTNPQAKKYDQLTFDEAISKNLKVMDQAAFSLCKDGNMPIIVVNMATNKNILRAAQGEKIGTVVR